MMEGHTMFTDGSCYSHSSRAVLLGATRKILRIEGGKLDGEVMICRDERNALRALKRYIGGHVEIVEDVEP